MTTPKKRWVSITRKQLTFKRSDTTVTNQLIDLSKTGLTLYDPIAAQRDLNLPALEGRPTKFPLRKP